MEDIANKILEKTSKTRERYEKLTELVSDPDIIADNREWKKLVKERSAIEEVAQEHDKLKKLVEELAASHEEYEKETDHELKQLFYDEIGKKRLVN